MVWAHCYTRSRPPESVHVAGKEGGEYHHEALPTVLEAEFVPGLKELMPGWSQKEKEDVMKKPAAHVSKKLAAHVSKKPAAHVAKKPAAHVVKKPATHVVKVAVGRTLLGSEQKQEVQNGRL